MPCPEDPAMVGIPFASTPPFKISFEMSPLDIVKVPAPSSASGQPSLSESMSK